MFAFVGCWTLFVSLLFSALFAILNFASPLLLSRCFVVQRRGDVQQIARTAFVECEWCTEDGGCPDDELSVVLLWWGLGASYEELKMKAKTTNCELDWNDVCVLLYWQPFIADFSTFAFSGGSSRRRLLYIKTPTWRQISFSFPSVQLPSRYIVGLMAPFDVVLKQEKDSLLAPALRNTR